MDSFQGLINLNRLDLKQQNLSFLPPGVFRNLGNLKSLDLSINRINSLNNSFIGMHNLESLDLSINKINAINAGDFMHMHQLKQLNLSNLQLATIELGSLSPFKSLEKLDLSNNLLKTIDFGNFLPMRPFLRRLYLNNNQLTKLTDQFDRLFPSLFSLAVTNNAFSCSYVKYFLSGLNRDQYRVVETSPPTSLPNVAGITCRPNDAEEIENDSNPGQTQDELFKLLIKVLRAHDSGHGNRNWLA